MDVANAFSCRRALDPTILSAVVLYLCIFKIRASGYPRPFFWATSVRCCRKSFKIAIAFVYVLTVQLTLLLLSNFTQAHMFRHKT
ncbi:hypothetical protein SISSUDRAFT_1068162 [Sistotremastrum suecicum HHB10207 ss-3]|uniref:Uncharacterized protein n=1 Tax=Sistotremastrum suecicum HHB10207 ss-3 TaxID=1314776 RepID=A0A165WEJ6_9AGAM|nr:hypothetical protein SISSUDRAFT_1068162 [Sistotremastrum suecicum HHB10207 ss-3]